MFSFLVEAGADVSLVADNGSSIVERAWFYNRTGLQSPGNIVAIYDHVFKDLDYESFATSQQYTVLHKIVLGLLPDLDLESYLKASTAAIDISDTRGRTPLWWACARGDAGMVKTLLRYGADVNFSPPDRHGPVHVAQTPAILNLLLLYGVDIDTRDATGRTALHSCSFREPEQGGTRALLKTIIQAGADVNASNLTGNTPLHFAAVYGVISHIEELVKGGADIEAQRSTSYARFDARYPDPTSVPPNSDFGISPLRGLTPLFEAVHHSQGASVEMLLKLGANPRHVTVQDVNIIRVAAMKSNTATMEALADAKPTGIDPELRDFRGLNARDYLSRRVDLTEDLQRAFNRLVASLSANSIPSDHGDSVSEDGEEGEYFEDAVESVES